MAADGTIRISTSLDNDASQKAMSKFAGIAKTGLKGVTVAVSAVSASLAGAAGYAIKTGIDFESAFAGVKKTVNASDEELSQFRQEIRDMAKEIPQSASSIAEVAEAAGQLGIKNENLMSFTRVMSDLGVATNMSATEAATSLARLANITQMPQENFGRLGSTIVALGNNLATTESEITEMGLRLAGAGKQVGMSEAKILGLSAAISSVGIDADAGGSAVSTVMTKMQLAVENGGDSLQQFADVAGMSAEQFQQAFKEDASQALVAFITGLGTMDARGKSAIATLSDMEITEIRQRDALLRLSGAGDLLSESLGIATQAWDENNALTKEAGQRYETLESRLQILKNNVSDLGISFYDSMRDPLKDTVNEGIEYVDQLSAAFSDGGLKGAVDAAGDIFADVAVSAAQHAPEMVNASVSFIQSFADGIYDNRGELIGAAGSIATALAEGLADLLPESVRNPVKDAVKEISESFKDGGLNSAVKTATTTMQNFGKVTGNIAKVTLPPLTKALDFTGKNLDLVAASAATAFTAFKGYKELNNSKSAFSKATKAISGVVNITRDLTAVGTKAELAELALGGALKTNEIVVGTLTGKISIVTAVQTAWNAAMSANPIGLVVTAVAALAAGIGIYSLMTNDASEEQIQFNREMEELKSKIDENREGLDALSSSIKETYESVNTSVAPLERLREKLDDAFDSTGKVKEGSESLATSILTQLNEAMGTNYTLTADGFIQNNDGVLQSLDQVSQSIDEYVEKLKQKALSEAASSQYAEALQQQADAQENLNTARQKYYDALDQYAEVVENGDTAAFDNAKKRLEQTREAFEKTSGAAEEAGTTLDGLDEIMDMLGEGTPESIQKALDAYANLPVEAAKAGDGIVASQAVIQAALSSTDYTKMVEGFTLAVQQIEASGGKIPESLQTSIASAISKFDEMSPEAQTAATELMRDMMLGMEGTVPEFSNVAAMSSEEVLNTFKQYLIDSGAMNGVGADSANSLVAGIVGENISGQLNPEARKAVENFADGFSELDAKTQEIWSQAWYGALKGLEGFEKLKDPAKDGADAFLESLEEALEVHSPSRAVKAIFENVWPGANKGLETGKEELNEKGKSTIQSFLESLGGEGLRAKAQEIGSRIMNFFGIGVSSQTENSRAAGRGNADAANAGASSVNPSGTGSLFGSLFGGGINGMLNFLFGQGKGLSDSANSGAGSVNPTGTGGVFGSQYASGVGSKAGKSMASGKSLASNANLGAGTGDGYTPGSNFGSGFVRGIRAWIGRAVDAAASLASSALAKVKEVLNINSPSKETRKMGYSFDEGLEVGIKKHAKYAIAEAEELAENTLNALDMDSIMDKLKDVDVPETMMQVYAAMDDRQSIVAGRIVAEIEGKDAIRSARNTQSDQKYNELLEAVKQMSKLAERPIITSVKIGEREIVRATAIPMQDAIQQNQKLERRLRGER